MEGCKDPQSLGEITVTPKYSDCYFCGGELKEQHIDREVWWHGRLHLIQGVPVGVCQQCGQKVILPQVAKVIDRMLAGDVPPDHFVRVPAYCFGEDQLVS